MLNPFWSEKHVVFISYLVTLKRLGPIKRVNVKRIKIQSQGSRTVPAEIPFEN